MSNYILVVDKTKYYYLTNVDILSFLDSEGQQAISISGLKNKKLAKDIIEANELYWYWDCMNPCISNNAVNAILIKGKEVLTEYIEKKYHVYVVCLKVSLLRIPKMIKKPISKLIKK